MRSHTVKVNELLGKHEICLASQAGTTNKSLSAVINIGKLKESTHYIIRKDRKRYAITQTLPRAVERYNSI